MPTMSCIIVAGIAAPVVMEIPLKSGINLFSQVWLATVFTSLISTPIRAHLKSTRYITYIFLMVEWILMITEVLEKIFQCNICFHLAASWVFHAPFDGLLMNQCPCIFTSFSSYLLICKMITIFPRIILRNNKYSSLFFHIKLLPVLIIIIRNSFSLF